MTQGFLHGLIEPVFHLEWSAHVPCFILSVLRRGHSLMALQSLSFLGFLLNLHSSDPNVDFVGFYFVWLV